MTTALTVTGTRGMDYSRFNADNALLNITWQRQNGELPDPIPANSPIEQIRTIAAEAIRSGTPGGQSYVPGIRVDSDADFSNFVVDFIEPTSEKPYAKLMLRFKTPFGVLYV